MADGRVNDLHPFDNSVVGDTVRKAFMEITQDMKDETIRVT